jgi:hypothetical protein
MRLADVLPIENSGISNRYYDYALRAHFDILVADDQDRPKLAIEFGGKGHDPAKDHLKNELCERFELPLVRITSEHLHARNFEHNAVAFLVYSGLRCGSVSRPLRRRSVRNVRSDVLCQHSG